MIKVESIRGAGVAPPSRPPRAGGVWRPGACKGPYYHPKVFPKTSRPLLCERGRASLNPTASFLLLPPALVLLLPEPVAPSCVTLSKPLTPPNLSGFICEMEPVHFAS